LITRIETDFGKRIDFGVLSKAPSIENLAEVLRQGDWSIPTTSLVPIQASGLRPPIYFVHGLGGHVIPFLQLSNHLGMDQPVYGLQAKAVNGAKDNSRTIEEIAGDYLREILEFQPAGPYFLGGFSFGGFVAYEMARQLAAKGEKVALLAILDTQARVLPGFRKSLSQFGHVRYQGRALREKIHNRLTNISDQNNSERTGGKPSEQEVIMGDVAEEEVPAHLQHVMKVNRDALRKYVPKGYHGKITLFKSSYHGRGVYYGWEELTDGDVEVFEVPGTHRGIMQEPSVAILATKISVCIEKNLQDWYLRCNPEVKS
jgi:thioesterase domain-containing protein